jgi:hypothetical protein
MIRSAFCCAGQTTDRWTGAGKDETGLVHTDAPFMLNFMEKRRRQ